MRSMSDTIILCIGIIEREKAGKGPENPETLRKLLDSHRDSLLFTVRAIKEKSARDEERERINTLEEFIEKFDPDSLRSANKLICGIVGI